jgi:type IV pilus assembly protein PilA
MDRPTSTADLARLRTRSHRCRLGDHGRSYGFTLIEIMVVVAILGLLASVAIPAMTAYMRRSKTAEARFQLSKMYDATSAFFNSEHVDRDDVATIMGGASIGAATHRCPYPSNTPAGGAAGLTPTIDCNTGPGGRCVPGQNPSGAGYYDIDEWNDNSVWNSMHFALEQSHYFRYNYSSANNLVGYGSCTFTAQAFADLDADGVYSTFERTGAADVNGINAAAGLYIDRVIE